MNVVITGASKGFGRSIAEKFAAAGHDIFICARDEEQLAETRSAMMASFPAVKINCKKADLSQRSGVTEFAAWLSENCDSVDVLVNNAGRFIPGSAHNEDEGVLEELIATNLYSAYHLTRAVLPAMIKRLQGHIFNICSIASVQAYSNGGAYSISKFALYGFSKNLREEMKPYNVKVTSVIPGAAFTDSWSGSGIDPARIMESADIASMIYAASQLSPQACVEEIVLRPQLGDL